LIKDSFKIVSKGYLSKFNFHSVRIKNKKNIPQEATYKALAAECF